MSLECSRRSMRAVHFEKPGSAEVLCVNAMTIPEPASGEVLIQVAAAGINRPDILQRKGAYPPPLGASPILGLEVAGKIAALGPDSGPWRVGDAVCALISGGGYAEYCIAPALQCLPIPLGLSMVEAAALPETFCTVWSNLFMRAGLKRGESLLVHGGSSGIGTTAIQLARACGVKVFVTAGSPEKCAFCVQLGASAAIDYRNSDFVTEIYRHNENQGIDVILDMIGGDYFSKNLELLAPEGRLVQIATQHGEKVQLSLRALMSKGVTLTGSTLRPRSAVQKGAILKELRENVWTLLETGKVRVIVDRVYPLEEASEAHQRMESSQHIGKIVLEL